MSFAGKILIAKEKNIVTAIKVNEKPTSARRLTSEWLDVPAGTVVLCVYEYKVLNSVAEARALGISTIPYVFILHNEKTWEASPDNYMPVKPSEVLKDKTVCFTGNGKASRGCWRALVETHGGTNVSSVSRDTSLLVMEDKHGNSSTKAQAASRYGTPKMTYEEFQKMLNDSA